MKRMPAVLLLCVALGGCEKAMRDMYDQPRYKPLAPSSLWLDGRSARLPPPDTVARSTGAWADVSSGRHEYLAPTPDPWPVPLAPNGKPLDGTAGTEPIPNPLSPTAATLARGRERFEIFCAPCHGPLGDGDGLVARRGFPHPPSYHTERLRRAADAHFYAVISHGYGAMYPYADRIPVSDRWAIVHYIRALQRSQNATLADVPPDARARLGAGK